MRNFYFNNDNRDGTAAPSKTEEWAQGFMMDFKSGYTDGTAGFGVDTLGLLGITLDSGKAFRSGAVSPSLTRVVWWIKAPEAVAYTCIQIV